MSRDDREQLEYIEEWKRKQQEKVAKKENKITNICMNYTRCKEYFRLGFKCLFACIREFVK